MTERLDSLHQWLRSELGAGDYDFAPASEDASFRRYFRVITPSGTWIVMDAPPEREDCRPFLDVSRRLLAAGVNVPRVFSQDLGRGFLLLSDLGEDLYLDRLDGDNADHLYGEAIEALLKIQTRAPVEGLPPYSEALLMQEMSLFRDWLLERHLRLECSPAEQAALDALFHILVESAMAQPEVFVHRDYHSRNLILNGDGPGIVDYQDAVLGPVTYDLVSLLKDCYVKWPRRRVDQWLRAYHDRLRGLMDIDAGRETFHRWFDLMGVQRHLKASGIFARLWHRDGKDRYLGDVPRTLSYIVDLKADYPELRALISLIEDRVLPGLAGT